MYIKDNEILIFISFNLFTLHKNHANLKNHTQQSFGYGPIRKVNENLSHNITFYFIKYFFVIHGNLFPFVTVVFPEIAVIITCLTHFIRL